jgi:hypothetical protein
MAKRKLEEPFVMMPQSLLESFAWRALSHAGQLVVSRIALEHLRHAGTQNGKLKVRKADFVEYGVRSNSVAPAQREAVALGLVILAKRGRAGNAEHRSAHEWSLAFVKDRRSKAMVGTTWKRFQSLPEARAVADEARKKKDTHAVATGKKRAAHRKVKLLHFPVPEMTPKSGYKTYTGLGVESDPKVSGSNAIPLSTSTLSPPSVRKH